MSQRIQRGCFVCRANANEQYGEVIGVDSPDCAVYWADGKTTIEEISSLAREVDPKKRQALRCRSGAARAV